MLKLKVKSFLFLIISLNVIYLTAIDWISFTGGGEQAPIIDSPMGQEPAFLVDVFGMYSSEITNAGTTYKRINIPEWFVTFETGEPELPVIRELIAIPECDSVILSANVFEYLTLDDYFIYPAPDYEEVQNADGTSYMSEVFEKNDTTYTTDQFYPNVTAEIKSIGYIRDQKVAEIWTYPIQFNPVTGQIKANMEYEISLSFDNQTSAINMNTGLFGNICQNTLFNYTLGGRSVSDNIRAKTRGTVQWIEVSDTLGLITADYLIIVEDDFFDINDHNTDIEALATHRATYNGFDVAIVNVEDILNVYECLIQPWEDPLWCNERKIRNFIISVYENGTANNTGDGYLGYLLLIGDSQGEEASEALPASYERYSNRASDYYYTCVTDVDENGIYDDFGDIFIGRFCVDDTISLHNIVTKTIAHENEAYFSVWKENVLLTVGNDIGFNDTIEQIFDEIENNVIPGDFDVTRVNMYEIGYAAASDSIIAHFNRGDIFVNYYGHGGTSSWQSFFSTDFNSLQNAEKQPIVLSIACNTGKFDNQYPTVNCMAEYFTKAIDKGSIGFLGSSRLSYISANFDLTEKLNESFWLNKAHISGELISESMIAHYSVLHRFEYIYFGDPALNILAGYFTAKSPENIIISEDSNTVNLSWNISEGATSYNIYSSYVPYSGYQLVDTVADTLYNAPINETKKFYYITSQRDVNW
jgi:hypothetical protein